MANTKKTTTAHEITLFDDAIIYKRGEYWHFRMWLSQENKYARQSLRTRSEATALEKGKAVYVEILANQQIGKSYFSLTTKEGVERYLATRQKDVDSGLIVPGRLGTLRTHLNHWLDFIGRDTKLKELERTDCEHYYHERSKTKKKLAVSQVTISNEQSTINAMMSWLHKHHETRIEGFDFMPLPRLDQGDESLRRSMFTQDEIKELTNVLFDYIKEGREDLEDVNNQVKVIASYYFLIAMITGLRRGEQLQLRWHDIDAFEHRLDQEGRAVNLVKIHVRAETSKVRKSRQFIVHDLEYFDELFKLLQPRFMKAHPLSKKGLKFADALIFSLDGQTPLTTRTILYHFNKVVERADINTRHRDLVPYSFRHYFITQRINDGLTPTAVANMCGTSIAQIEKTYYHMTRDKMIDNALTGYY